MAEHIIYPGQGGMNKDASYNIMPEGDYPYALNCIRDESGTYGMITNAKGNKEVSFSLPDVGINKVIGFVEDSEDQAVIYFVYNNSNNHCIVRYYTISGNGPTLTISIEIGAGNLILRNP